MREMLKIALIGLIVTGISTAAYADSTRKIIEWRGKTYVEEHKDILDGAFDMCACIKEAQSYYPDKTMNEARNMCFEAFKEYLMKKSEKQNAIVTGTFVNDYCNGRQ